MARVLVKNASFPNPPNLIINGGFDYFQRSFGPIGAGTSPTYITADRWMFEQSGSGSFLTSANSTNFENRFKYSCHLSHGPATNGGRIWQRIESSNIAPYIGKTMTWSIWVQVISGTLDTFLMNTYTPTTGRDTWLSENTSETAGTSTLFTAPTTGVWTRLSHTFLVTEAAKDGLVVLLQSNNIADTAYRINGAMLTEGRAAPVTFYRAGSSLGDELQMCQYYYQKSFPIETTAAQNGGSGGNPWATHTIAAGAVNLRGSLNYPVTMRIPPVVTTYNPSAANSLARNATTGTDATVTNVTGFAPGGQSGAVVEITAPAGWAANQAVYFHWAATAEL